MTINGVTYDHDLILHHDQITNWWRKEGHRVSIEDLKDLPENFETLVIGNGASGCCDVPQETIRHIKEKGVEVVIQQTAEAVKTYNQLHKKGEDVVGAFHLTC